MMGTMHSYNMYQSTMYPAILKSFKNDLDSPDEIMKQLYGINGGCAKDEAKVEVTRLFEQRLKNILNEKHMCLEHGHCHNSKSVV